MSTYALAVSAEEIARYRMMATTAAHQEAALWDEAGISPGAVVADVGCGPGAMSVELARRVGPAGRVLGVERDESALAAAQALVASSDVDNIELRKGEASDTGIPTGSIDVAMLRHVLAHNGGAEQGIVDHLAQLVRPRGCVYLVDVDLTAVRVLDGDPEAEDLNDRYVEFQRRRGNDVLVGLRLGQLLEAAGLDVVTHEGQYNVITAPPGLRPPAWAAREAMVEEAVASRDDVARWERALARMDAAATRPVVFAPVFVAVGRRRS